MDHFRKKGQSGCRSQLIWFLAEPLEERTLLSTYDAAANFSTAANPNGVWSYGEIVPGGNGVTLYPDAETTDVGLQGWTTGSSSPPYVAVNNSGTDDTALTVDIPSGVLDMHPGPDGEYSVTQFTAPTAGALSVAFTFTGVDTVGTTTDVHVLHNLASIADGSINAFGATFSQSLTNITVAAGDTIDFTVGWGANQNYLYDSTSLSAQITLGGGLSVVGQPAKTAAGTKIDGVKVAVLDSTGSVDPNATTAITAAITPTSTGKGTLSGTTTVSAVAGIASFDNLLINEPGQYTLTFTDAASDSTQSGLFEISGGQLRFKVPPKDGSAGSPLQPAVEVELVDKDGKVITSDSTDVVTLTPIGLKANPVISGNTEQLVNGVATFSDLELQNPDFYKLTADDGGDADVTSSRFKISGDHLKFTVSPTAEDADTAFPVKVGIYNAKNQLDTTATSSLQLSLNVLAGNAATALGGTTLVQFAGGLAIFTATDGPIIASSGRYTLTATEEDDSLGVLGPSNLTTAVVSKQFTVSGFHLAFKPQPKNTDTDVPLDFSVELLDRNNKVADSVISGSVALTLLSTPATGGSLSAFTNPGFVQGVDEFSEGISPSIDTPGKSYTLRASALDDSGNPDLTISSATSAKFQISGLSIKFLKQPLADNDVKHAIPFTLELVDSHGKINTTETPTVSITASPATTISVFINLQFENGLATYTDNNTSLQNIKINAIGRYTLTATAINSDGSTITNIEPGVSDPIHVFGYHFAFIQEPDNSTSRPGNGSSFEAALEDIHNKIQTDDLGISGLVSVHSAEDDTVVQQGFTEVLTSGEINISGGVAIRPDQPGEYTVEIDGINSTDNTPSTVVDSVTSHIFKVFPAHLVFADQPVDEPAGNALPEITVEIKGADGETLDSQGDFVQLSYVLIGSPVSSAVILATQQVTNSNSVIFDLLYIHGVGRYKLIATLISSPVDAVNTTQETVTSATSNTFTIRG